ncbi:uncharacterized protein [Littorina saxatilis]|uniref:uncharacterized protein n=1 Tax=Littorina saxatilis TaxID=31220 RepID=UPI0038B46879
MALPNMTDNFSFSSKIVDAGTQHITYLSEFYDYEMRVMRYELQSLQGSVYGTNPLSRVHDFNTGVAYTTDRVRGNCTATPITTLGFDSESVDSAFVRMRTSQSFFDLTDRKYTYTGQRTVRDIECDTWITVKDDWPPSQPFETHWEWYFATRSWMESVGYQYEVRLPVQLRITAHNFDVSTLFAFCFVSVCVCPPFERIFNLYNYKKDQNNPWDFSISACFNSSHRKEYTLTIPGNYSQYVGVDQSNFQFFFTLAVTAHAQVSALRVANVKSQ